MLLIEDDEETIEDFVAELAPLGIALAVAKSKATAEGPSRGRFSTCSLRP